MNLREIPNLFLISENIACDDYTKKRVKEINAKLVSNSLLTPQEITIILQAYKRMFSIVRKDTRTLWQKAK